MHLSCLLTAFAWGSTSAPILSGSQRCGLTTRGPPSSSFQRCHTFTTPGSARKDKRITTPVRSSPVLLDAPDTCCVIDASGSSSSTRCCSAWASRSPSQKSSSTRASKPTRTRYGGCALGWSRRRCPRSCAAQPSPWRFATLRGTGGGATRTRRLNRCCHPQRNPRS